MKNRSPLSEAKDTVVDAAKSGLEGVKDVAGEALGAAAAAAAGVVMVRTAEAFLASGQELKAAAPSVSEAVRETAAAPLVSKPASHSRRATRTKTGSPSVRKSKAKSASADKK